MGSLWWIVEGNCGAKRALTTDTRIPRTATYGDASWCGNKSPEDGVHKEKSATSLFDFSRSRETYREREREIGRKREASGNDQYYDNSSLSRFILSHPPRVSSTYPRPRHFRTEGENRVSSPLTPPLAEGTGSDNGGSHVSEARAWPSGCPGQPVLSGYRPGCDEKGG